MCDETENQCVIETVPATVILGYTEEDKEHLFLNMLLGLGRSLGLPCNSECQLETERSPHIDGTVLPISISALAF